MTTTAAATISRYFVYVGEYNAQGTRISGFRLDVLATPQTLQSRSEKALAAVAARFAARGITYTHERRIEKTRRDPIRIRVAQ